MGAMISAAVSRVAVITLGFGFVITILLDRNRGNEAQIPRETPHFLTRKRALSPRPPVVNDARRTEKVTDLAQGALSDEFRALRAR